MIRRRFKSHPFEAKAILLFASLVGLFIIGGYFPSLGLLVIAMVIVLTLELTKIRFKEIYLPVTFIALSTLTLFWGWFGPYLGSLAHPIASMSLLAWGVYCLRSAGESTQIRISLTSSLVILLGLVMSLASYKQIATPLLWGYDNSAHLPALSQVYRHHGFLYSGKLPEGFTFSNYVNGYPPLTSGTWAFLMSIGNIKLLGGYQISKYFGFFTFLTGLLTVSLVVENWSINLRTWMSNIVRYLFLVILAVLVGFSQLGFVFWAGFPPYIWTCCLIIVVIRLIESQTKTTSRLGIVTLGFVLVNYSYPLLSPVIILIGLFELAKIKRTDFSFYWAHKKQVSAVIGTAIILTLAVVYKSLNVRHYLNDGGGIQPLEIRNLIVLILLILPGLYLSRSQWKSMSLMSIALLAGSINFAILAILSTAQQGAISYYPQKAGYLALILGFCALGSLTNIPSHLFAPKYRITIQISALVIATSAVWFSVHSSTNPRFAKYGFMSTSIVWDKIRNPAPNMGRDCFYKAMVITSDLNSNSDNTTILYLEDDLGTRWINGIRGRLTDATYSLSIPVGMAQKPVTEIISTWLVQYPKSRLLVLAPTAPAIQTKYSDRITHRIFSCS
jgi:hypothetical protein